MSFRHCAPWAILCAAQAIACGAVDTDTERWEEESGENPTVLDEGQSDEASETELGEIIEGESTEVDDEEIGQVTQGLHNGWFTGPFNMQAGFSRELELADTHVCILSKVQGDFDHRDHWVHLFIDRKDPSTTTDDRWVLDGSFDMNASALCFKQRTTPVLCSPLNPGCVGSDGFVASSSTRMIGEFVTPIAFGTQTGCRQQTALTFLGDATTFITGVEGAMRGGGEVASVQQSFDVNVQSSLRAQSCAAGTFSSPAPGLVAYGASFFAGTPRQKVATFVGPTFGVATSGTSSVMMAEVHSAMCHFTKIQGGFQGGAEIAEIAPVFDAGAGTTRWRLRVSRGSASDVVAASARCYARDQR